MVVALDTGTRLSGGEVEPVGWTVAVPHGADRCGRAAIDAHAVRVRERPGLLSGQVLVETRRHLGHRSTTRHIRELDDVGDFIVLQRLDVAGADATRCSPCKSVVEEAELITSGQQCHQAGYVQR